MAQIDVQSTVLESGLRVVTIDLPSFHSVTNFLVIRSGSRYETSQNNGIAHFLEHMVFKGTKKYGDHLTLAKAIEGVGGRVNAWTNFDHTAYWNVVPSDQWAIGADLPLELAYSPLLRSEDLERERGVIVEEIRMVQDDPSSYVGEMIQALLYAGHPLGRPILGTEETIKNMKLEQFREYQARFYQPAQSVFVAAGNLGGRNYAEIISEKVGVLTPGKVEGPEEFLDVSRSSTDVFKKDTDQTHFVIGSVEPLLSLRSKEDRYAANVLSCILGRGMSSRLFVNVREKRGLAYSVSSHLSILEDTGSIGIYGGVNTEKITESLQAIRDEFDKLQQKKVDTDELGKAKAYICGAYDLQADQPLGLAEWYGLDYLFGQVETHEEAKQLIQRVTAEQVQAMAKRLFDPKRMVIAAIGPYESDEVFRRFVG